MLLNRFVESNYNYISMAQNMRNILHIAYFYFIERTMNIFYAIDHNLKRYVEETHFSKFHNFYPNGLLHMFDSC